MKLFLLSTIGERHEDRIPQGIFESITKIKEYLQDLLSDDNDVQFTEEIVYSDYDQTAIELRVFYYYENEAWSLLDKSNIEPDEFYIIEKWDLNEAT